MSSDRSKKEFDIVDKAKHYNIHPSGIECINIIELLNFNIGNAIKYIWRSGLKDKTKLVEDLKKAVWYLNREKEKIASYHSLLLSTNTNSAQMLINYFRIINRNDNNYFSSNIINALQWIYRAIFNNTYMLNTDTGGPLSSLTVAIDFLEKEIEEINKKEF